LVRKAQVVTVFSLFPLHPETKTPALAWDAFKTGARRSTVVELDQWRAARNNLAVATGSVSGCIVLDCDSMTAWAEAMERGLPDTYTVKTPRGWHIYFAHPGGQVGNRAKLGGVLGWDIRGDGGYVVAPGSHYTPTADELAKGKVAGSYEVETDLPLAAAPQWLLDLLVRTAPSPVVEAQSTDTTDAWGAKSLRECVAEMEAATPGNISDTINRVIFRIAQAVAGGHIAADDAREGIDGAFLTLGITDDAKASDTYARAWRDGSASPRGPKPQPTAEEVFGTRPAAFVPVVDSDVPDPPREQRRLALTSDQLSDKSNHLNIEHWITASGALVRFDEFADVVRVGPHALTDHLERQIWLGIREASCLAFPWDLFGHTIRAMAWANRYHPLRDYLNDVQPQWDGTPRIDGWLSRYMGVAPSEYTEAVGALFLTALVRRVRHPGAKFDEMIVIEGPQGLAKSSALAALCPREEWFTDEVSVGMTSKELLEITSGKWIVEAPELKGLVGRGVDHVKAFLSRRFDKARMAYERNAVERGREWVPAATTNDGKYLDDPTGNRRVWPVIATRIDLEAIRLDRDQMWAEAAQREASGASIRMPAHLWEAAAVEQAERVLHDSLLEALEELLGDRTGRVRGKVVLDALRVPFERQAGMARKFGEAMRTLGWANKLVKVDGEPVRFYVRGDPARSIIYEGGSLSYEHASLRSA
jgi:predicted P-loop ATPase